MIQNIHERRITSNFLVSIAFGLFLIAMLNVWAAIILGYTLLYVINRYSKFLTVPLNLLVAFFLAKMNFYRPPSGDLIVYYDWYELISRGDFDFSFLWREPFLFYLMRISTQFAISKEFFLFIITLISYLVLFHSFNRFCRRYDLGPRAYIFVHTFLAFNWFIFNSSSHLIRQYLAGVLLIYGIASFGLVRKYFAFAFAPFFHASVVMPLSLYLCFSIWKQKFRAKILFIIIFFLTVIAAFNVQGFEYIIYRLEQSLDGQESGVIFSVPFFLYSIVLFSYFLFFYKKISSFSYVEPVVLSGSLIALLLVIFYFISTSSYMYSARSNLYLSLFIPFYSIILCSFLPKNLFLISFFVFNFIFSGPVYFLFNILTDPGYKSSFIAASSIIF